MSRLHTTLVALVLGAATAAGLFAAVRTVQLGQKTSAPETAPLAARDLASRQAKLDRWSMSLRQQRAKQPPALPKLPKFAPVKTSPPVAAAPAASPAAAAPQVSYVRPTVVKYRHASASKSMTSSHASRSGDDGTSDDAGTGETGDGGSPETGD